MTAFLKYVNIIVERIVFIKKTGKKGGIFLAKKSIKEVMSDINVSEYLSDEDVTMPVEVEIADITQMGNKKGMTDINLMKLAHYFVQGYTEREMAEAMGVNQDTIKRIKSSDEFKAVLKSISLEVVEVSRVFLASAGLKAVRTLVDCLDSASDKIRLGASKEVLDRIGLKSPEKIELIAKSDSIQQMSDEQLFELVKMGIAEIMPDRQIEGK